ncbi:hypothetical protein [Streptomyces sp. JH34]|uniref:hypothetical protein n=1 Tax=Streptomyces sp. JH34 TaxID=2793633 RepID=UPI0023F798D2|nr:hypothetical protein [Streptomyces sp. JH34]MDF6019095.1 hypothetical protein [Streptomyces sp. JH34]
MRVEKGVPCAREGSAVHRDDPQLDVLALRCLTQMRELATAALPTYGFRSHAWPVTHAVTELIAVNAALTPGRDLYLSLRQRDGALRLVLWDQHPRHADPDALAGCELRRRRALWLLAAVVDDWGGSGGSPVPSHRTRVSDPGSCCRSRWKESWFGRNATGG